MRAKLILITVILSLLICASSSQARRPSQESESAAQAPAVVDGTLISPGASPFHLKAIITEGHDPNPVANVEIWWAAPDKWRRTIQSDEFSQTLVVNGDRVFEQDSDDYFPIALHTLVTAMVDPGQVLAAHRTSEELITKANGRSSESGLTCFADNHHMCLMNPGGLTEIVGMPGHSLSFSEYEKFKKMRIARMLTDTVGVGEFHTAKITRLEALKDANEARFSIDRSTAAKDQIRSVTLTENALRSLALESHEIIWPQPLDGRSTGTASFYVSVDRAGRVREVLPVYTDNERTNDSARRQIMTWKFIPPTENGLPAQAESVLTFALDTRAWGPTAPLSDAEVRKLASNIVDPVFPPGIAPSGTVYTLRVAVDSDGHLIETIPATSIPDLFRPCMDAIARWHFSPIMENGQPRPYRGEITFRVP